MEEWAPSIRPMPQQAGEVHLAMNANNIDRRIANSRLIGSILGEGLVVSVQA